MFLRSAVVSSFVVSCVLCAASAQESPFPVLNTGDGDGRGLPEIVPLDVFEPRINPRQTEADRLARIFNSDLREIEEQQAEILSDLKKLPQVTRELQRFTGFGYVSGDSKQRPKWLQMDLGAMVEPDAIALFPVTAEVNGETVYGYGFPRSFRIDISNDAEFRNYETVAEGRTDEPTGSRRWPYFKKIAGYSGRYIRVTATSLWRNTETNEDRFALSEVMVLRGDRNVAVGRPVKTVANDSSERSNQWSKRYVTDGVTTLGNPHGAEESPTFGFRSRSKGPASSSWVQIDLEESMPISEVRVVLADSPQTIPDPTVRFPYPMKIEVSESPDMREAELLGRFTPSQISLSGDNPLTIPVKEGYGRYVRLTVTNTKEKSSPMMFELAELQVFSEFQNVSTGKTVTALSPASNGGKWAPEYLVDGFSSRRKLVSYQEWLSELEHRNNLIRKWLEKEDERRDLVDSTVTRGVTFSASGLAGIFAFVLIALSRARVKRRHDLEDLRQRIASDLHDDIGSNLSSIALLAELGKTETDEPELVIEEFSDIKVTADKTIESMRDIVWLIRPGEETWAQMLTRFRETASKLLRAHEYQFEVIGSSHDDRLPLAFKRDLFLIYKEVLNNIVKHAQAHRVHIEVEVRRSRIELRIKDDGIGFNNLDHEFREGNGLRNLRMRAQAIGANLKVKSARDEGTSVQLTIPMP